MKTGGIGIMSDWKIWWLVVTVLGSWTVEPRSSGVSALGFQESANLREEVREMFYFTYDSYLQHAFPRDELRPLTCDGQDTIGGYALTLIESLDMLAVVGNQTEFARAVAWVCRELSLDLDKTVSLFETNIRLMGGLLSAHMLAVDVHGPMHVPHYKGELLELARELGDRLLPAFDSPTGIPFGSVNLRGGVPPGESTITCTAAATTLSIEFTTLSRLTGEGRFEAAAWRSLRALWERRSQLGLVGGHIDITTGDWTQSDSGIGTSVDSFYEYLVKSYMLFGDLEYVHIFREAYQAVQDHLRRGPWYVEVNMFTGNVVWPVFNSLQAFWPGLQVLAGFVEDAAATHRAFFSVWQKYGFTPEGYHLLHRDIHQQQKSYPLRPELAESTYLLFLATGDRSYQKVGREMVTSLQRARTRCGYAMVKDVTDLTLANSMESFFLSETLKYLYLLFDAGVESGGDSLVFTSPWPYVFSTEGHLFPIHPNVSSLHQPPPNTSTKGPKAASRRDTAATSTLDSQLGDLTCNPPSVKWSLNIPELPPDPSPDDDQRQGDPHQDAHSKAQEAQRRRGGQGESHRFPRGGSKGAAGGGGGGRHHSHLANQPTTSAATAAANAGDSAVTPQGGGGGSVGVGSIATQAMDWIKQIMMAQIQRSATVQSPEGASSSTTEDAEAEHQREQMQLFLHALGVTPDEMEGAHLTVSFDPSSTPHLTTDINTMIYSSSSSSSSSWMMPGPHLRSPLVRPTTSARLPPGMEGRFHPRRFPPTCPPRELSQQELCRHAAHAGSVRCKCLMEDGPGWCWNPYHLCRPKTKDVCATQFSSQANNADNIFEITMQVDIGYGEDFDDVPLMENMASPEDMRLRSDHQLDSSQGLLPRTEGGGGGGTLLANEKSDASRPEPEKESANLISSHVVGLVKEIDAKQRERAEKVASLTDRMNQRRRQQQHHHHHHHHNQQYHHHQQGASREVLGDDQGQHDSMFHEVSDAGTEMRASTDPLIPSQEVGVGHETGERETAEQASVKEPDEDNNGARDGGKDDGEFKRSDSEGEGAQDDVGGIDETMISEEGSVGIGRKDVETEGVEVALEVPPMDVVDRKQQDFLHEASWAHGSISAETSPGREGVSSEILSGPNAEDQLGTQEVAREDLVEDSASRTRENEEDSSKHTARIDRDRFAEVARDRARLEKMRTDRKRASVDEIAAKHLEKMRELRRKMPQTSRHEFRDTDLGPSSGQSDHKKGAGSSSTEIGAAKEVPPNHEERATQGGTEEVRLNSQEKIDFNGNDASEQQEEKLQFNGLRQLREEEKSKSTMMSVNAARRARKITSRSRLQSGGK